MRFCEDHWTRLRAAIDERGLSALVADSGEKAAGNLSSELSHGSTVDNFDPLMGAHNAIWSNCMTIAGGDGMRMMLPKADGSDWCPLCFVNSENPHGRNYDEWIDRAADDMVDVWKALGS